MYPSLTIFLERLLDPDKDVRVAAALQLGQSADRTSVALAALIAAIRIEPDPFVRETLTWAIAKFGDRAIPPMSDMLADTDFVVRHQASHVLGKIGTPDTVPFLIGALADPHASVRFKSALALGEIGEPRAIPYLISLLGDENVEVQSITNAALDQLGDAAVAPLCACLSNPRALVRRQAAEILGMISNRQATSALADALHDVDADVRFAAISALHDIGGPGAWAAMRTAADDSDARVRAIAKRAP